ncbi:Rop family plasmid primer RNA-binding protein [Salmonella enterica]|uniref:Rop family plasmid primer RNA-binding protein n=1 Tax=Salmonella enterica TaxID=28901 RepID=UPI000F65684B|nr:Rop family plasmid primer RNA-binding protein [Salmonella enterica]TWX25779.1 Rop family plasmid primer RNA-binding protein [Salmonella enterica subsp. enterica serovar Java]
MNKQQQTVLTMVGFFISPILTLPEILDALHADEQAPVRAEPHFTLVAPSNMIPIVLDAGRGSGA